MGGLQNMMRQLQSGQGGGLGGPGGPNLEELMKRGGVDGGVLWLFGDEGPHPAELYFCWSGADNVPGHPVFIGVDVGAIGCYETVGVAVTRLVTLPGAETGARS